MEPLVALSLAGTVVQFVDFGSKLLKDGRELYTSKTGTLKRNEELELITTDLEGVIRKFRELACSPETQNKPTAQASQGKLSSFESLCDEATNVAEELVTRLKGLKAKKSSHPACDSIRQAVRFELVIYNGSKIINRIEDKVTDTQDFVIVTQFPLQRIQLVPRRNIDPGLQ